MEHAGNQLREAIKKNGMTQEQAAERLGITRKTIGQWLKRQVFDANTLHEIYIKLQIDLRGEDIGRKNETINLPREIFDKLSQLIDTVCSQQSTIANQQELLSRQQDIVNKVLNPPPSQRG